MLNYNTRMPRIDYDAILFVLDNKPQSDNETYYNAITKDGTFVVYKTDKNKIGFIKNYIVQNGKNFDCSAALNAALNRK